MGLAKYILEPGENPADYRIGYSDNINAEPTDIINWQRGVTEVEILNDGNYTIFINKIGSTVYYQQFATVLCNVCSIKSLKPSIKSPTTDPGPGGPVKVSNSSIALIGIME